MPKHAESPAGMRAQTRLVWLMLWGGLCSGEAAAPLNDVLFNRTCSVGPFSYLSTLECMIGLWSWLAAV